MGSSLNNAGADGREGPRSRPAVSAHRGGSEASGPATWEAYRDAAESGAEYVEFDIRRTKDGAFVVHHDARVNRTGPPLATLTRTEASDLAGRELPEVGAVMELAAASGMAAHLDLKEAGDEREIVGLALDVLGADRFVATTLEDASIATIAELYPHVRTALSVGRARKDIPASRLAAVRRSEFFPLRRVRECGAGGLAMHRRLAGATVLRQCAAQGLFAMVWTVNDDEGLRRFLADRRVDVLITDRPRRALALRTTELGEQALGAPAYEAPEHGGPEHDDPDHGDPDRGEPAHHAPARGNLGQDGTPHSTNPSGNGSSGSST